MATAAKGRQRSDNKEESTRGEYLDRVVKIKRCAAVVKGGRRFSFAAMVVVGDGQGRVGWGYGKANEVPPSVEKATKQATRSMIEVPLVEGSIPHQVIGRYGSGKVVMVPAGPGTGVIAGAAVRAVCGHNGHPYQELRVKQSCRRREGHDERAGATANQTGSGATPRRFAVLD